MPGESEPPTVACPNCARYEIRLAAMETVPVLPPHAGYRVRRHTWRLRCPRCAFEWNYAVQP